MRCLVTENSMGKSGEGRGHSSQRLLVLDFDGTMTDAEAEGAPFRVGYLEDLSALTGREIGEIEALAAGFEAEITANPDAFGWVYGGQIVAPAIVDPYLRIMPVARKIFDRCGAFMNEDDRTRLLDAILYKYNYTKTKQVFKKGAGEALRALTGSLTYVVSNSHTSPVQEKIRALGARADGGNDLSWLIERVFGRAMKYVVDPDFSEVAETMTVPGLTRPILLRRRPYFEVLHMLLSQHGLDWGDLVVVGDIFELDLALPLAMGATVGLVVNEFTPGYERTLVETHARGHLIEELRQLPTLIQPSNLQPV